MMGQIRISQLLAGLIVVASVIVWLVVRSKIKRFPEVSYATLYVNTEEAQDVLANGYHPEKKKHAEAIPVDIDEDDLDGNEEDEEPNPPAGEDGEGQDLTDDEKKED